MVRHLLWLSGAGFPAFPHQGKSNPSGSLGLPAGTAKSRDLAVVKGSARVAIMLSIRNSLAFVFLLFAVAAGTACQQTKPVASSQAVPPPPIPASAPAAKPATSSAAAPLPNDSVPAIARREVIRRQEQIRRMDEAALRASQAMAYDDLEGAVEGYRRAVDGLPN